MNKQKIIKNISIRIPPQEVFRYLGYKKGSIAHIDSDIKMMIHNAINRVNVVMASQAIYQKIAIQSINENGEIYLEQDHYFLFNQQKVVQLKNIQYLLFAVVTIGKEADNLIKSAFNEHDYFYAVVMDAAGTVAVKTVGQWLSHYFSKHLLSNSFQLSRVFGPGSGDWAISEQQTLFQILRPEQIGVYLNSSCMMSPAKSLSWIQGMGCNLLSKMPEDFSCKNCLLENCQFRKNEA